MTGELPQGWASASVNEIAEINPRHPKGLDDSMTVTFVPMAALSESKPEFQFTKESTLGSVRKGFTHFADGDVLFAKITPCMENGKGAVAVGLRNGLGCGTTEVHVIRPLAGIPPYFLYYFLAQTKIRGLAKDSFTGTAGQSRVPTSFIEQLEIPLAPLPEQQRIVATLEKLLPKLDACQNRLAKVPFFLKRFRQSVLSAACSGRLTNDWRKDDSRDNGLPSGWKQIQLEELLPPGGIFDGPFGSNLKTSDYTNSGIRVIRLENIGHLRFIGEKETYVSRKKYLTLKKHTVAQGDIIFASFIDEDIRVCVLPALQTAAIAKADCFCLRPKPELVDRRYLTYQLASWESYNALIEQVHGATRPRINTTQLRKLEVRVCPLAEQKEIVRRVRKLFTLADTIEGRYRKAQQRVDYLSQSILAKAFRGELVPTEAELADGRSFESAEKLLERISRATRNRTEDKQGNRSRSAKKASA